MDTYTVEYFDLLEPDEALEMIEFIIDMALPAIGGSHDLEELRALQMLWESMQ